MYAAHECVMFYTPFSTFYVKVLNVVVHSIKPLA